ncbi:MAG: uL15 family ribosomal protein [archaeon]|jgi:large subunit ribosomal protein L15|nr:uL15 family ribosomal protein [archaeon]
MKTKKRRKNTRYRGSQTHRRGHRKRTKGSGNRAGFGMANTGKKSCAKKMTVIKLCGGMNYFGGDKTLRRGSVAPKLNVINLSDLVSRFDNLLEQGIAKQTSKGFEFNLKGYKVLAGSGLNAKVSIKATTASKSAIEQVKAAGGTIELERNKEEKPKEEKKEAKK